MYTTTLQGQVFLSSIGNAQLMQELENKVLDITKRNSDILEEKIGEEPSMTNEEIKNYVHYVMNEYGRREKAPPVIKTGNCR